MSYYPNTHCGGVRSLEAIRQRCRIDAETGCWNWSMAFTDGVPRVFIPAGVLGDDRHHAMGAHKAAWLLSGRKLAAGRLVFRQCRNVACCNPEHCKALTPAEMGAALAAGGTLRGCPVRTAVNKRITRSLATPPEVVRRGEALLAAGMMSKDMAKAIGVNRSTASKIKRGTHVNSSGRRDLVRGASVFDWRGSLAVNDERAAA